MIRSAGAAVTLLAIVLSACGFQSHRPIADGTYILLLDIPKDAGTSFLLTGSKTYHSSGQWDLPVSLRNTVRAIVNQYDLRVVDSWPLENIDELCLVVRLDAHTLAALKSDRRISAIQPVNHFDVMGSISYNDPQFVLQFGKQTKDLERLHEWATGENIKVGIIDTPVDLDHEDLRGQIISQQIFIKDNLDEKDQLHGTAVAGIIAANSNNGVGVVGFAPDVSLSSYAACYHRDSWQRSVCDTFALAKALAAAAEDDLDIVNLSLSGPEDPLLTRLISSLVDNSTIVVAADNPANPVKRFPASMAVVIAVTTPAEIHRFHPSAVRAPDEHLSNKPGNGYQFFYGTSMSAARVTALTSLMVSKQPVSYNEVRAKLVTLRQTCKERDDEDSICSMRFAVESDVLGMNAEI
ncbi:MAG: S8 family serine peptidase [Pseudomonadales bacterium]|nr:S8 family serine peptidase [Pseudomonadales bacterium]MDP7358806.1 S8 family serine peptidase [Pseudomonadales bacterium]MDP7596572.1 S8 family serine peptidase [Pseudomonadales bacterium]HJN51432.1 S8 family serine peptidase [Pseudomonadales bacterium]